MHEVKQREMKGREPGNGWRYGGIGGGPMVNLNMKQERGRRLKRIGAVRGGCAAIDQLEKEEGRAKKKKSSSLDHRGERMETEARRLENTRWLKILKSKEGRRAK